MKRRLSSRLSAARLATLGMPVPDENRYLYLSPCSGRRVGRMA